MPEIESRGFSIVYDVAGSGSTVLLVGGASMWRTQWSDAGYVAALSGAFRVITVDPLGHGDSAKPHDPSAYHPGEVAGDLVAVLDAVGVAEVTLWGFSAGAQIALGVATVAADRVRAVICGSGGWRNEPIAERAWCRPIVELLRAPNGLRTFWSAVGFDDPDGVAQALGHNDSDAIAAAVEGSPVWRPDYARLTVPILSYRGEREQLDDNDRLMHRLNAEAHIVPGAGHTDCFDRSEVILGFAVPFLRRTQQPLNVT